MHSTGSHNKMHSQQRPELRNVIETHVGSFRYIYSDKNLHGKRRSSTAYGPRRRAINSMETRSDCTFSPNAHDTVLASVADCACEPFCARGSLLRRFHSTNEFDDRTDWVRRWVEIRGPFLMLWQNSEAAYSAIIGAKGSISSNFSNGSSVTMPDSVIDLRTVSTCGLRLDVLYVKFKDISESEIYFRPALRKWRSEFHFWLRVLEETIEAYKSDPDLSTYQNFTGERIVDAENNPPMPPPRVQDLSDVKQQNLESEKTYSDSPKQVTKLLEHEKEKVAEDAGIPTAEVIASGSRLHGVHTNVVEEDEDYAAASPVTGCFACGFLISVAPSPSPSTSRASWRTSIFTTTVDKVLPNVIDPSGWMTSKLKRNTVKLYLHSLVTTDPRYEMERRFKVKSTLTSSGDSEDFSCSTGLTTFNASYRFPRNSRVVWSTLSQIIDLHFELIESIAWYGRNIEIIKATGYVSLDTSTAQFDIPFKIEEDIDFFDVETGDIINVKLRNEINVERTMPLMDNIIKQHRVKENNQPVMSELNARAEDYHSKETEVETNFMLSDVTDNGNDSEYSYETE